MRWRKRCQKDHRIDKVINERNLSEARRSKKVKIVQGDIFNPEE